MMRRLLSLGLGAGVFALSSAALAEDLPLRKAGLWEMKITKVGGSVPEMTMQHCTDPTTDKEMNNSVSPLAKQMQDNWHPVIRARVRVSVRGDVLMELYPG